MGRVPLRADYYQPSLFESWDEPRLAAAAMALGAAEVGVWAPAEHEFTTRLPEVPSQLAEALRRQIHTGGDPLGELFCAVRSPAVRRPLGATYTPLPIVRAMVQLCRQDEEPAHIVDPGCGSARFLLEAGRVFPKAELIGYEVDRTASILARANLATAGFAGRSTVVLQDYRAVTLPKMGRTLFVGNPPYVRHHLIPTEWKDWLVIEASKLGLHASQLAGLHVYFFLATVLKAKPGDFGCYITSAEWLDVNYGSLLRELFLRGLGGKSIMVLEPTVAPFPDAATTGAVTAFRIGARPDSIVLSRTENPTEIADPDHTSHTRHVRRERLEAERRWSHLTRGARDLPSDLIELGELCRVHRGTVTGANKVWISGPHSTELPSTLLYPTVTRARELINAGEELADPSALRSVIDLPENLDLLCPEDRKNVDSIPALRPCPWCGHGIYRPKS